MNQPNLSAQQMQALLNLASSKLGVSPQELQRKLQSGSFDLGKVNSKTVSQILNDPKKIEAILKSKEAQAVIQRLSQR